MGTRFIHAADLHLGVPLTRFDQDCAERVRGARIQALENLLGQATANSADFVVIAGDLFDDNAIDSTTSRRAFHILENASVPVYVLPGNHDPLLAGSVWEREPWSQETTKRVKVLRERQPLEVKPGVILFPCPVFRKTSMEDPTGWIPPRSTPDDNDIIRIGIAHGSIRDRANLPDDDHLIDRNAAETKGLDYLALGHWHRQALYHDPDGVCRAAYPGVHEPMSFRGADAPHIGWVSYAPAAGREVFRDQGAGEILLVTIDEPGAGPQIQNIAVGHLTWTSEPHEVRTEADVGQLISQTAARPAPERWLLRLRLDGVLNAKAMLRLDELKAVLRERYLHAELDTSRLHLMPEEEEIREVAGSGVVQVVASRLVEEAKALQTDESEPARAGQAVAERALLLLYQIAKEVQR